MDTILYEGSLERMLSIGMLLQKTSGWDFILPLCESLKKQPKVGGLKPKNIYDMI